MLLKHSDESSHVHAAGGKLSAFTVIELLVVVVVIGILSALLLPTLVRARSRARQTQCTGNLSQLAYGLSESLVDEHSYPLYLPWFQTVGLEIYGDVKSLDYRDDLWVCPSARWKFDNVPTNSLPISYGYNAFGLATNAPGSVALGLGGQQLPDSSWTPTHESDVVTPSEMMAIGDCFDTGILLRREDLADLNNLGNASARHQGKANVVYCDGHVESPTLEFFDQDRSTAALVRWNRDHQPH